MSEPMTGAAVVAQAKDNSWWNKDPLVMKAAVVGFSTSVLVALGAFGLVSEEQRVLVIEQVGNIAYGLFTILPMAVALLTAVWARVSVYSPRTAARIAVENAGNPAHAAPTLEGPP